MNDRDSQELVNLRRERAVRRYCAGLPDLISPEDVSVLIVDEVTTSADGQANLASVQEAIERLKRTRPYLFRSARADRGITAQGVPPPRQLSDAELAPKLFGRNSDSKAALALAMSNKQEYSRLKKIAQSMDLIG